MAQLVRTHICCINMKHLVQVPRTHVKNQMRSCTPVILEAIGLVSKDYYSLQPAGLTPSSARDPASG